MCLVYSSIIQNYNASVLKACSVVFTNVCGSFFEWKTALYCMSSNVRSEQPLGYSSYLGCMLLFFRFSCLFVCLFSFTPHDNKELTNVHLNKKNYALMEFSATAVGNVSL